MKKFKVLSKISRVFNFEERKKSRLDSFGYGAILIEETMHSVNMHLSNYIVSMLAKHNTQLEDKINNFFLRDVDFSERFFRFKDDSTVPGSSISFERKADINKWQLTEIYVSPRKHIRAYEAIYEDATKRFYIDIDLVKCRFTKDEKSRLFKVFKGRMTNNDIPMQGISEKDFNALAISYAWNLVMCMQEICVYKFGDGTRTHGGFHRMMTWIDSSYKDHLLVHDRNDILSPMKVINYALTVGESHVCYTTIHKICEKIAKAMYKYEQIHMRIPLDWIERTDTHMYQTRRSIDRMTREMHNWFMLNNFYTLYGDCIEDMILSPLRVCDVVNTIVCDEYLVGKYYAKIFTIAEPCTKANINKDWEERFDNTPLVSDNAEFLNVVIVTSCELQPEDLNADELGKLDSVFAWVNLWSQVMGIIYQKTGIKIFINESLEQHLAANAINAADVLTNRDMNRIISNRAKAYAKGILEVVMGKPEKEEIKTIIAG